MRYEAGTARSGRDDAAGPERGASHEDPSLTGESAWQGVGPRWLLDRLRRIQRRVNPLLIRTFAGRGGPYGVVRHVGRRSGRQYATPVVAFGRDRELIVPLPYSSEVDWLRNLEAAGGGQLQWKGRTFRIGPPEEIDQATALPAFPAWARLGVRMLGVRQFLRLRRVDG